MPATMWARRLVRPGHFERIEVPAPTAKSLKPGETLLRVRHAALCGSDYALFRGKLASVPVEEGALAAATPGFPLHEVVGEVLASDRFPIGSRVVGWSLAMTGLAELTITPNDSIIAAPDHLDDAHAVTVQPLACVVGTVKKLGDLAGRRAAIIGQGPFGLMFGHVLKQLGAAHVTGVDPVDRSDVAAAFGIDDFHNTMADRWSRSLADADRPDIVVEAVGHQTTTLVDAVHAAAPNADIFYFGVPDDEAYILPMRLVFRKRLTLTGGTVIDKVKALHDGVDYLTAHPDIHESLVTHVFPVDRADEAYAAAASRSKEVRKVQLTFS